MPQSQASVPGPTKRVAAFVAGLTINDVPQAVQERVRYLILDGVACGLVGAKLPWSKTAVEAMVGLEGEGDVPIWGWGRATTPTGAALLNGTFVQGFELDDYHEHGPLHSASIVLPAILATAARTGRVDGEEFLLAAAVGFEIGPRLGVTMDGHDLIAQGWHCGVVYGTVAAAVACAKARGLDAGKTEDAIGLATTQASGLMAAQYESMVKRMNHSFAARAGVLAGALAEGGFTGIKDALERPYGGLVPTFTRKTNDNIDYSHIGDGLGDYWELENILVKPYSSGGTTHPGVDAMLKARNELGVKAEDVASIDIRLPVHSFKHYGWKITRPTTPIGGQMNLGYVCAVALLDGNVSIGQFSSARLASDDVWDLVGKISCRHDPEMDTVAKETSTPRATGFRIALKDGTIHEFVQLAARGKGDLILTNEEIEAKAEELLSHVCDDDRIIEIKQSILGLGKESGVAELNAALAPSVGEALGS